ncbi:alpha/beta fold hydrolase [Roseococcus sp. YIM B11640]|uniref:alpha/beta fold hydrolase n=1 Tax=Roseococcus sp. YIM B11640 TaxID=3133973 RepID=UPI003C7C5665
MPKHGRFRLPFRAGGSWSAVLFAALLTACAPAVVGAGPSVRAPALSAATFHTADDQAFRVARAEPEGPPRAVVLGLHGMNNHATGFLREVIGEFTADGLRVITYDQRNHGRNRRRGIWPGEAALTADAEAMIRLVREENPGIPLFVLGESMGANTAFILQDRFAGDPGAPRVDGWLLLSPGLWTLADMGPATAASFHLALRSFPGLAVPGRSPTMIPTDNDDALERLYADPDAEQDARVDTVWGMLQMMQTTMPRLANCCTAPTLVMIGARDPVAEERPLRTALRTVPQGQPFRVARYPEGRHLLLLDRRRDIAVRDILAFTRDPAMPLPSGADRLGGQWLAGN